MGPKINKNDPGEFPGNSKWDPESNKSISGNSGEFKMGSPKSFKPGFGNWEWGARAFELERPSSEGWRALTWKEAKTYAQT